MHDASAPPDVLASSLIEGPVPAPRRDLYMLHGIYGRGRNWAALARRLAALRDDWRMVLVDLRGHGESPAFSEPHTVNHAARDVARLAQALGRHVDVVLGHSFGGKVALAYASVAPPGLEQVWLIDSTPAPKIPDGSAWRMLGLARAAPGPFATRRDAAHALELGGIAPAVAAWMASNVAWRDGTYHWRLDFDLMESLLHDFFRLDYWHVLESPPPGLTVHVVRASESSLLGEEACRRIERAGRDNGQVHLHHVRGGHWIHTDNPEAVTALLAKELPGGTSSTG